MSAYFIDSAELAETGAEIDNLCTQVDARRFATGDSPREPHAAHAHGDGHDIATLSVLLPFCVAGEFLSQRASNAALCLIFWFAVGLKTLLNKQSSWRQF